MSQWINDSINKSAELANAGVEYMANQVRLLSLPPDQKRRASSKDARPLLLAIPILTAR